MNPDKISGISDGVTSIYQKLEENIFLLIAERLKTSEDITADDIFGWQADKVNQLQALNADVIKELSKATGLAEKEIRRALEQAMYSTINAVDSEVEAVYNKAMESDRYITFVEEFIVLAAMGGTFKPLKVSESYSIKLREHRSRLFNEFNTFISNSLISSNYGHGTVARMYNNIIRDTVARVMAGDITISQAVSNAVIKWSEKGLPSGFTDKGGNAWSLERYANATMRTTVNNIYNDIAIDRMKEYGTDLVLVSSLSDPREACSHIQGNVASLSEPSSNPKYPSVYEFGYGQPWGLRGINCRHQFFVWFEGISENNQPQWSREEMDRNYQLSQKQRYYERQIRKAKQGLNLAKEMGDEVNTLRYQRLLRGRRARMREFINGSARRRQYERERVI